MREAVRKILGTVVCPVLEVGNRRDRLLQRSKRIDDLLDVFFTAAIFEFEHHNMTKHRVRSLLSLSERIGENSC